MNAVWIGCNWLPLASPSTVRIFFPFASSANIMQALTVLPSTSTVHAPHAPRSQTRFVPVNPMRSRNASKSVVRGSIFARRSWPFTTNDTSVSPASMRAMPGAASACLAVAP